MLYLRQLHLLAKGRPPVGTHHPPPRSHGERCLGGGGSGGGSTSGGDGTWGRGLPGVGGGPTPHEGLQPQRRNGGRGPPPHDPREGGRGREGGRMENVYLILPHWDMNDMYTRRHNIYHKNKNVTDIVEHVGEWGKEGLGRA